MLKRTGEGAVDLVTFERQRQDAELDVVGEDSYQHALVRVCGGLGPDGTVIRDPTAILVLEPENTYDGNAVAASS